MSSCLDSAVRRYLSQAVNRAHYRREALVDPGDARLWVKEVVRARRQEVESWRRTWWQRLSQHPSRILDAGCGPGFVALALAQELPHAEVVGVDIEPEAVAVGQILARDQPNLTILTGALETLSPDLDKFDLIVCRTTLEHVQHPRRALGRLLDALAPGGSLFLETPNYLFPYEPHLQVWMLPKSPKWLLRAECRLCGRDARFADHLQLACDPVTLGCWCRRHGRFEVINLMRLKVLDVIDGRQTSAGPRRQRALRVIAPVMRRLPGVARRLAGLPIWPSAQLLVTNPAPRGDAIP